MIVEHAEQFSHSEHTTFTFSATIVINLFLGSLWRVKKLKSCDLMLSLSLHVVQEGPPVRFVSRPSAVAWEKDDWALPLQRAAKEQ